MFLCLEKALPKEPEIATTMEGHDLKLNDQLQYVDSQGEFFNYYKTDNEPYNERRKHIIHDLVREDLKSQLGKFDIVEMYVRGQSGLEISSVRPENAHLSILVTKLKKLKQCKKVIVICGDSEQDAGVLAWRYVMREGGLRGGTILGFVEKLYAEVEAVTGNKEECSLGFLVLSPGQLLYSPQLNKNMSFSAWFARERKTAVDPPYQIVDKWNKVPGHHTPIEHFHKTVYTTIRKIIRPDALLSFVTIGDGAKYTMECFSNASDTNELFILARAKKFAFVAPTHDEGVFCKSTIGRVLWKDARSWVISNTEAHVLLANPLAQAVRQAKKVFPEDDQEEGEYQYPDEPVPCPTYSAGYHDYAEMVWPSVEDKVIEWLTN